SGDTISAVSRLLAAASTADRPDALAAALVREARRHFDVPASLVFVVDQRSRRAAVVAGDPHPTQRDWFGLDEASPLAEALGAGTPMPLSTAQARGLALAGGLQPRPQAALVAPMVHPGGALAHVLMVADDRPRTFEDADLDAAAALAEAARASLAQLLLAEEHGAQRARQSSIARGAKALNESLALPRVLPRICEDAHLLESFAELAAVACRNASVHADLAEAARTDALTGCMNHAALHETLRREMQRSRRTGRPLTVVLVDLDNFKQVNERQGHLA